MKPLDLFVRDVVAPALNGRGYKRSGRSFVLETGPADYAFVGFQEFRLGQFELEFYVSLAAVFGPLLEWFQHQERRSTPPTEADGLWRTRLLVPGKPWIDDPHLWEFDLADKEKVQVFRRALDAGLEKLEHLADRRKMLAALRHGQLDRAELQFPPDPDAVALLLSDEGPSAELDQLASRIEAGHGPDDDFLLWLRGRIQALHQEPGE